MGSYLSMSSRYISNGFWGWGDAATVGDSGREDDIATSYSHGRMILLFVLSVCLSLSVYMYIYTWSCVQI